MMQSLNIGIKKMKELFRGGFFHILIGNTLTKMLSFLSSIVIVRLVSKEEYAYLTYSDNLYLYIIAISGLGMSSAILKYCGTQYNKEKDKAFLYYALTRGFFIEFTLSILIVCYVWITDIPFPEARGLVSVMILYPALNYVVATFQSYARARLDNRMFAKIALIQSAFVLIASIVLVKILGIYGMAYARYMAMGICCIVGIRFAVKQLGKCSTDRLSKKEKKDFIALSLSFMFASLFSMLMPINETFLINKLLEDEIISANYKVAMLIPSQTMFISNSIAVYFFTILNRTRDRQLLWKIIKKIELLSATIIGVITLIGIFVFPLVLQYVYGEKYLDCVGLSNLYWIVYGINSGFRLVALNLIPAFGNAKVSAFVSVISAVIHVCCCYFVIPIYGVYGAAMVLGIIYIIAGSVYWGYIYLFCKNGIDIQKHNGRKNL